MRDLGGLPTSPASSTRRGVVFRAATPQYATPADIARARRLGFTTFVDLRQPRPEQDWRDSAAGVTRVNIDLVASIKAPRDVPAEAVMRIMLDHGRREVAAAVAAITDPAATSAPVVFHCHTGKDRTGLVAVLLLVLAGVEEDAVIADYLASNGPFREMREELQFDRVPLFMPDAPASIRGPVVRESAEEALRFVAGEGGSRRYLESGGLPGGAVERAAQLLH